MGRGVISQLHFVSRYLIHVMKRRYERTLYNHLRDYARGSVRFKRYGCSCRIDRRRNVEDMEHTCNEEKEGLLGEMFARADPKGQKKEGQR